MESRAREGLRSGASLFKELRSSLRGAAGLPGFRDAQSQDALPNARILGSIRTRGSGAQRRECGGRSCRADLPFSLRCPRSPAGRFSAAGGPYLPLSPGASRSFYAYASAAGVRPFPEQTAPGTGRQRLPVAVFPALWYFAALFFRGGGALSPPFPCLSAERRNSGVK